MHNALSTSHIVFRHPVLERKSANARCYQTPMKMITSISLCTHPHTCYACQKTTRVEDHYIKTGRPRENKAYYADDALGQRCEKASPSPPPQLGQTQVSRLPCTPGGRVSFLDVNYAAKQKFLLTNPLSSKMHPRQSPQPEHKQAQ